MGSGVQDSATGIDPLQRQAFRAPYLQPEGAVGAHILEGKVVDINLKLWTVDVISQFDQKWYLNVQVASPYMHSNRGDGIYVMPEIGAKCHVCIPSDGPPPFVLDFIMPQEGMARPDVPDQGDGAQDPNTEASFHGGRVRPKPGDIYMRGRDGQFVILHRGGVLQIGSSELAQRIYIPLQNLVTDISQNYRHYNAGGSEGWFLAAGESETNPPTIRRDTYRLLAGDALATIRVTKGKAKDFITAVDGDEISGQEQIGMGSAGSKDNPLIYEVAISPDGFAPDTGTPEASAAKTTVLRYVVDKQGGVTLAADGGVFLYTRKKLRIVAQDSIDIVTKKNFSLTVSETARIDGGKLLEINGKVVKINGGSKPVATVGSLVEISIGLPLSSLTPAAPGAPVLMGPTGKPTAAGFPQPTLQGIITTGNPTILG